MEGSDDQITNLVFRVVTDFSSPSSEWYHGFKKGQLVRLMRDTPRGELRHFIGTSLEHGHEMVQTLRRKDTKFFCKINFSRNKREGTYLERRTRKVVVDMEVGGLENPHKISIQSIRPRGKPLTVVPREDALDALEINLSAIASAIL